MEYLTMYRSMLIVLLSYALLLTGCRASTRPQAFIHQSVDSPPVTRESPRNAIFRLYALTPSQEAEKEPLREMLLKNHLQRGERVGFVRDDEGRLFAVAGSADPFPLASPGSYLWEMQSPPGQFDSQRTGWVVAVLVVVGVVLIILILSAANEVSNELSSGWSSY